MAEREAPAHPPAAATPEVATAEAGQGPGSPGSARRRGRGRGRERGRQDAAAQEVSSAGEARSEASPSANAAEAPSVSPLIQHAAAATAGEPEPRFAPLGAFDVPSLPARETASADEDGEDEAEQPAPRSGTRFGAARAMSGREPEPEREAEEEKEATQEPAAKPSRRGPSATPVSAVTVDVTIPRGYGRRINAKLVRQVVEKAIEKEGLQQPVTVDVVMVTDEEMREINATRRGIDEATDVLSFPLMDLKPGQGVIQDFFQLPPDVNQHLGDVVISVPRVESQAEEAGHSRERELAFLTVHGILHILGYDHDTDERRRQMRRREEEILGELGLRRNGNQ